jgi:hypothetical protein
VQLSSARLEHHAARTPGAAQELCTARQSAGVHFDLRHRTKAVYLKGRAISNSAPKNERRIQSSRQKHNSNKVGYLKCQAAFKDALWLKQSLTTAYSRADLHRRWQVVLQRNT